MPILHAQFSADRVQPDGKTVPVPPKIALLNRGPVIQVTVSIQKSFAETLLSQGRQLPIPLPGLALIDTGASNTCIDEEAAVQLALPVIDVSTMVSASHDATPKNVYPVQIEVTGWPISISSPRTVGAALKGQGLLLLIGGDVLQHGILFYNGMSGEITWSVG